MTSVIKATVDSVMGLDIQEMKVLDAKTFMDCFDNYVAGIKSPGVSYITSTYSLITSTYSEIRYKYDGVTYNRLVSPSA
jgi:hypothetical protein